jgi:hypothetical protein
MLSYGTDGDPCQRFARNRATRNLTSPHDPTLGNAVNLRGCVGEAGAVGFGAQAVAGIEPAPPSLPLMLTRALGHLSTAELRHLARLLAESTDLRQVAQAIVADLQRHLPTQKPNGSVSLP